MAVHRQRIISAARGIKTGKMGYTFDCRPTPSQLRQDNADNYSRGNYGGIRPVTAENVCPCEACQEALKIYGEKEGS